MDVVGIGDVQEYCDKRDWTIAEQHEGSPLEYKGKLDTIVWGGYHRMFEFYYLRLRMLRRGKQLLSVHDHGDMGYVLEQFVQYVHDQERAKYAVGHPRFGWSMKDGQFVAVPEELQVIKEVLSLYDEGCSYREIWRRLDQGGKRNRNGGRVGLNTVAHICKNREEYLNG